MNESSDIAKAKSIIVGHQNDSIRERIQWIHVKCSFGGHNGGTLFGTDISPADARDAIILMKHLGFV